MASTASLNDNFNDNSIDAAKWIFDAGGQVVETNQQMEMSSITGGNYVGIYSGHGGSIADYYDLTESSITVQIVDPGSPTLASWEMYPIHCQQSNHQNNLWMMIRLDSSVKKIHAYKKVLNVDTDLASVNFDANLHKWFRIRETGGTTFWQYSTNGISWTTLWSETTPITITAMQMTCFIGTWQAEGSTTKGIYDNYNLVPAGRVGSLFIMFQ